MGKPTLQGLTTMEARAVSAKVASTVLYGTPLSDTQCVAAAGYSDPNANVSRIFNNPRVQQSLRDTLDALGADADAVGTTFLKHLQSEDWRPSLRAAEDIARIRGDLRDTAPIQQTISVGVMPDLAKLEAVVTMLANLQTTLMNMKALSVSRTRSQPQASASVTESVG